MKRGKADKSELHGFEALLQRLIAHGHVRITRMPNAHGVEKIAKVLFDESAVEQIAREPDYAHVSLHVKKSSSSFVRAHDYGTFVYALTFDELRKDMPFHPRESFDDTMVKRGDRLANLLADAPEIGAAREDDQQSWVTKKGPGGHDDGLGTRTRRGGR